MKRIITALFILAGLCCPFLLSAQDSWQSLINRLTYYSPEKYKLATDNLKKKYPDSYRPDKDFEKALEELKADKETLIKGLKAKDPKAEKQAQKLLQQLDAALLANPLLAGKQVVAIRRTLGDNARKAMSGGLGIAPSNFQNNSEIGNPKTGWTNEFVSLNITPGKIKQTTIYKPEQGMIITDPEPHFDGNRLMYSSIGTSDRWHLFELDMKTGKTRQLTPDSYKDFDSFDGCYTPDGRYIFCSLYKRRKQNVRPVSLRPQNTTDSSVDLRPGQ